MSLCVVPRRVRGVLLFPFLPLLLALATFTPATAAPGKDPTSELGELRDQLAEMKRRLDQISEPK